VPWTTRAGEVAQQPDYFACGGPPASDANGFGRCESCGTLMICPDPPPGELYRITLIACDSNGIPLPHSERHPVQFDWGERVQADGRPAKVLVSWTSRTTSMSRRSAEQVRRASTAGSD
jgi:hypothetical protein